MLKNSRLIFLSIFLVFLLFFFFTQNSPLTKAKEVTLSFSIGEPIIYENLKVFPVELKDGAKDLDLVTLDEAVEGEFLEITEVDGGQVNTIAIENTSKEWVFLLAGEIIIGAKQNRIIGKDTLVPPESGKIKELVFCVESGRWVMESDKFYSYEMNTNMKVRQTAHQNENQSLVWDEVAKSTEISNKENPTGKFDVVYEDEDVQQKIDEYLKNFEGFVNENESMTGVVVVAGNEIIGADIFGDRILFEKLWSKLLKSYIVDALVTEEDDVKSLSRKDVEDFLDKFKSAEQVKDDTAVSGTRIDFASEDVVGGIVFNEKGDLIHFVQFPYIEVDGSINEQYQNNNVDVPVQLQINAPNNQNQQQEVVPQIIQEDNIEQK